MDLLNQIRDLIWGLPLIILLLGTGLYLTILLKGIQIKGLFHALYLAFIKRKEKEPDSQGDISHFEALMTALSATVGTGNIAGVATAITLGGPGALVWMWITGFLGMATKYAEAVLAVKYRIKDKNGQMAGGPMYYLKYGLNLPVLGTLFAIFAFIASFGIGNMVQSNSVAQALAQTFHVPNNFSGVILAFATFLVIIGGIKSIGKVTSAIVPIMILFYIGGALLVILFRIDNLLPAIKLILVSAFSPKAATGGVVGFTLMKTIQSGVARGIFSNESGLGSSPIAAAAAKTNHPVTQALVSMTQTFIDTIVVCTLTGLVIVITNNWNSELTGAALTSVAFQQGLEQLFHSINIGGYIVSIGLILFAYSTLLGWSYYGEKSIEYLLGEKFILPYRILFVILIYFGAVSELKTVWTFADIMNGLMAFPNLIGLIGLSYVIKKVTESYEKDYNV